MVFLMGEKMIIDSLGEFLSKLAERENVLKIIVSNPKQGEEKIKKIVFTNKFNRYMVSKFSEKQCFTENIEMNELNKKVDELFLDYKQLNIFSNDGEFNINRSKKGKIFVSKTLKQNQIVVDAENNRSKNYILKENQVIQPLVDMGIFTPDGKIVKSMYDKYKQINRFIELINDAIKDKEMNKINIVDFGCGKSYLTFIVYYYFKFIKKLKIHMVGLDLKKDVIEKCNEAARKYGYEDLYFEVGDINGYKPNMDVDMVISLHACDIATDHALFNAIKWNVKMIFSVPCCQHEVNAQIRSKDFPIITRYGLVKERISSDFTDIVRCNLLKAMSYNVDLIEFVDFEHTPKNILIRGIKTDIPMYDRKKYLEEAIGLMKAFEFNQKLHSLLKEDLDMLNC